MADTNPRGRTITQEELDRLLQLPLQTFHVGSKQYYGRYDEVDHKLYEAGSNGMLTGKVYTISNLADASAQQESDETVSDSDGEDVKLDRSLLFRPMFWIRKIAGASNKDIMDAMGHEIETQDQAVDTDRDSDECKTDSTSQNDTEDDDMVKKKRIIRIAGLSLGVVLIGLLTILLLPHLHKPDQTISPTPAEPGTSISSKQQDDPSALLPPAPVDPSLGSIEVIQVIRDLIPGDTITADDIQSTTLSAETYNQISLAGSQIYQWSRASSVLGTYVLTFTPKGQYLTYDSIASVYYYPTNPWYNLQSGMQYVLVPVTDDLVRGGGICYGTMLDLTVTKQTVQMVDREVSSSDDIPGLSHQTSVQQSYQVDTYGLKNLIVCDLFDADRQSIYPVYTAWSSIPTGEQYPYIKAAMEADPTLIRSVTPAYIQVKISDAQVAELGDLTTSAITVNYRILNKTDVPNDDKRVYAAKAKALSSLIYDIRDEIAAAQEESNG